MITRRFFYISFVVMFIIYCGLIAAFYIDRQKLIDLEKDKAIASELQVGIWKTQYQSQKDKNADLEKENKALYDGIQADTLLMDYITGLASAQKEWMDTVKKVMENNGIKYPEFIYKVASDGIN